jgi:hypothetical protein
VKVRSIFLRWHQLAVGVLRKYVAVQHGKAHVRYTQMLAPGRRIVYRKNDRSIANTIRTNPR